MRHGEALRWLFGLQLHGVKLGLDNIRALLAALGHPDRSFPAILITGSNGKGSVAAMLTSVLSARGLRVGTYTSPHLVRFAERIAIDGRPIATSRVAALASMVRETIDLELARGGLARHPTFFEATTAMAFVELARCRVDIGVIEVGLGGRFDATNACEPVVSVLTGVALEHTRYLGDTLEAIAFEKSGIARSGRPFVVGLGPGPALRTARAQAAVRGARLVLARREVKTRVVAATRAGLVLEAHTPEGPLPRIRLPLAGRHQENNLRVAIAALRALPVPLRPDARSIARGLARTCWPGRLERVPGRPTLLLDGAHNPDAALTLRRYLSEFGPGRDRLVMLFACLGDKDTGGIVGPLFPLAKAVVAVRVANPRALAAEDIAKAAPRGLQVSLARDSKRGLALARRLAGPGGLVVVTGSLYLVGEVKALLAGEPPPDQG